MSNEKNKLIISSSPHVHKGISTSKIMWMVSCSLAPAAFWSIWLFGLPAAKVLLATILFALMFEGISQFLMKKPFTLQDGSAVLTGLLLALTLPPGLPLWICAVGAFIAIIVGKSVFGGLGQNPFNPAMTGRVFLLIAFPDSMTKWLVTQGTTDTFLGHAVTAYDSAGKMVDISSQAVDTVTAATPLGLLAENGLSAISSITADMNLFVGNSNGSLGETSSLLLLLGGLFLLWRGIISWHIPVSFLLTVTLFATATWLPEYLFDAPNPQYANPLFHLFTGGIMIGAWFMATDYVTSPMFPKGKIIFGIGLGALTMLIRLWGSYPEGISFAILLMNACVPLIDTYTRPKKFGWKRLVAQGGKNA